MFGFFPRWMITIGVVFIAIIQVSVHLPDILLIGERFDAMRAELASKVVQLDIVKAQAVKASNEARKSGAEAEAAQLQPKLVKAQLDKAIQEASQATYIADSARWKPAQEAAAAFNAEISTASAAFTGSIFSVSTDKVRMLRMFDNLDPNRPFGSR